MVDKKGQDSGRSGASSPEPKKAGTGSACSGAGGHNSCYKQVSKYQGTKTSSY